jgi:hypothetical protein
VVVNIADEDKKLQTPADIPGNLLLLSSEGDGSDVCGAEGYSDGAYLLE